MSLACPKILGKPLNLRIKSKLGETPDTAGWKTRGVLFP